MQLLILLVSLVAILVIFYALLRAMTLNRKIPGGLVKASWRLLYYLIGLLAIGYLTLPLFPRLPASSKELIIAIIYLAGAVFVVMVINLIYRITREVGL